MHLGRGAEGVYIKIMKTTVNAVFYRVMEVTEFNTDIHKPGSAPRYRGKAERG